MACPGINARRVSLPSWLPAPDEQTQRNARVLALNRSEHPTGKMDSYLFGALTLGTLTAQRAPPLEFLLANRCPPGSNPSEA